MPSICYFEIPAENIERARRFYSELFDWKIEKWKDSSDYWEISTTTQYGVGIPGGLEKRQDPQHRITCHIDACMLLGLNAFPSHTIMAIEDRSL